MDLPEVGEWSYLCRYRSLLVLCAFAAAFAGCNPFRQPERMIDESADLSGQQSKTYLATIPRDAFLRIQLDQYGLDYQVGIEDPGSTITWYESGTGRHGLEIVILDVTKTETVAITIKSNQRSEISGRFRLQVDLVPRALDAETSYSNGSKLNPPQTRPETAQIAARTLVFENAASGFAKERRTREAGLAYLAASELSESGELDLVHRHDLVSRAISMLSDEANSLALATALVASVAADLEIPNLSSSQAETAVQRSMRAQTLFANSHDLLGTAEAGQYLGEVYLKTRGDDAARVEWEKSESLCRQAGSKLCIAQVMQNLGRLDYRDGNYGSAIKIYETALSLFDRADHVRHYAVINENIGYAYRGLGLHDAALRAHILAFNAFWEGGRCGEISGSLYALGHSLQAIGSLSQAMQAYSLVLASDCTSAPAQYSTKPSTSVENRQAILTIETLCSKVSSTRVELQSIKQNMLWTAWDIGNLARLNGNPSGAMDCHRLANTLAYTSNTRAGTNTELADDLLLKRDLVASKEVIDRVLTSFSLPVPLDDPRNYYYSRALLVAGRLASKSGDRVLAHKYLGDALSRFDKDQENRFECLRALAESSNTVDEALKHFEAANALLTSLRASSIDLGYRASLFSSRRDMYVSWIGTILESGGERSGSTTTDNLALRTLVLSERSRARVLSDLLSDHEGHVKSLSANSTAGISSITQDVLMTAAKGPVDSTKALAATDAAQQLFSQKPDSEIAEARLLENMAITIARFQNNLTEKTAVVQYLLGTKSSYVWVLTHHSLRVFKLPPSTVIQSSIDQIEKDVKASRMPGSLKSHLGDIYAFAIRPIEAEIVGKDLFVVADESLYRVPFAALWDSLNNRYLSEAHVITMLPSISASAQQAKKRSNSGTDRRMLLVGDAVYDQEDFNKRCSTLGGQPPRDGTHNNFARLTGSGREIEAIEDIANKHKIKPTVRTACSANAAKVLGEPLDQYTYIHFATHATVNTDVPQRSAIQLSSFDERGLAVTSTITVNDILSRNVSAELVVLSSCATAGGHIFGGEGALSLNFALLAAGGQHVLSTLWPAADSTTEAVMVEFYQHYLRNGYTAAQALRQSQLRLIKDGRWSSPRHWGNYVVTSLTLH